MNIKIIIILLIIGVAFYFGVADTAMLSYGGPTLPAFMVSNMPYNLYSCYDSAKWTGSLENLQRYQSLIGDMLGQKVHRNVAIINTEEEFRALEDDSGFRHYNARRYGGDVVKGGESLSYYSLDEGVPAQIDCSGNYNCDFGYTTEEWELDANKCYLKSNTVEVYKLENNGCIKYTLTDEESEDYYKSLQECLNSIASSNEESQENENTESSDNNEEETIDKSLIQRINDWIDNLLNKILGAFK